MTFKTADIAALQAYIRELEIEAGTKDPRTPHGVIFG
jgi:hypothetical protein